MFLRALIKGPFLGGLKLSLAERSILSSFSFYTTSNESELDEIYKIRYHVYCEEYKYLEAKNYPDKREKDRYDACALHLVIRHKSGDLAATARLILDSEEGLPIEKHFKLDVAIPHDSRDRIAEISRLIVAKSYRRRHLLLVLIKGLYLLTKKKNVQDIFCVLDDRLLPNLKEIGVPLHKVGPPTVYQGLTTPYLVHLNELEEAVQEKNSTLFKFLSKGDMKSTGKDYKYAPH